MNPPDTIKTPRLILRKPDENDVVGVFEAYAHDLQVTRFLTWRPAQSVADTESAMRELLAFWDCGADYSLAIVLKNSRRLIGMISMRPDTFRVELGYVLGKAYWGQGYMTEAVKHVVAWLLPQPEIFRIAAVCDVENTASARVMEKAGMQREGTLRRWSIHPNVSEEPRDCFCYSLVK